MVAVVLGADVVVLVDAAALGAALNGVIAGHLSLLGGAIEQDQWGGRDLREARRRCASQQGSQCSRRTAPGRRRGQGSGCRGCLRESDQSAVSIDSRVVGIIPLREASRGRISKTSTPSVLPRISRRSRPVACSRSVGTVPGWAPGPIRSSSVLTSVRC